MDDHPIYRSGLRVIFQNQSYISIIHEAANGKECIGMLQQHVSDIVLMDMHMPEMDGIMCVKIIRNHWPKLKVVALGEADDIPPAEVLLGLGVRGYMMKDDPVPDLIYTFEEIVFNNKGPLHRSRAKQQPRKHLLQKREIEILKLLCRQLSSKQIAERLFISKNTVDNHRKHILKKTGMQNTAGLVSWAIQNGFALP